METIETLVSLEMEANQIIPKNKKEFKSKLNTLVIENKLKEALEIAAWEAQGDGNVEKEITLQKARVNELERQERLGISKPEDVEVQRIRIRAAILELGDHLLNKDEI